jgi:hypothetical protein
MATNWLKCSASYYLTIKRDEKPLAARQLSQQMVVPFARKLTPQMTASRRARRETHKWLNTALQFLPRDYHFLLTASCLEPFVGLLIVKQYETLH